MATTRLIWSGGGLHIGIDSHRHSIVVSTQDEATSVGMKPSDLLLIALASCTAVDVVAILAKKRQPLSAMEIVAEGRQDPEPPWAFRSIHLAFRLRGARVTREAAERAIELAEGKYCSVAASLRPQVAITTSVELLDDEHDAAVSA
ncbi:MAG TPA: OsmC family protein [Anaerolineales bacterium]|nr:OsmC family protein [Anaerolineales bacterium]